jgi:hypothetical protein
MALNPTNPLTFSPPRRRGRFAQLATVALLAIAAAAPPAWAQEDAPGGDAATSDAPFRVEIVSSMRKLRPDQSPPAGEKVLSLHAARGESESAQVLVIAVKALRDVKISLSSFSAPGGGYRIAPRISLVEYLPIKQPSRGGFGAPGLYPDPLMPERLFDVPQGENRSVWVTVTVPPDAPADVYSGQLTVSTANTSAITLPTSLRVHDVTLPARSRLKTLFEMRLRDAQRIYGKTWDEKRTRRLIERMLEYRLCVPPPLPWEKVFRRAEDGSWTADWTEFDAAVEGWMRKGTNFFLVDGIFPWYGSGGPITYEEQPPSAADKKTRADRAWKLRLLDRHLQDRGWSEYFGLYLFEEPTLSANWPRPGDQIGPRNLQRLRALAEFVRTYAPHLRVLCVAGDPAYPKLALDEPAWIWVPQLVHFQPGFCSDRQEMGEPAWTYVSVATAAVPGAPDFWRIDRTGTSHRAMGWWLYTYGCDGLLYWNVFWWPRNLFVHPTLSNLGTGDGYLWYPDYDGLEDPVPSIRLEILRDGIEDYDLLAMLAERAAALRAEPAAMARSAQLARKADLLLRTTDVIDSINHFTDSPRSYDIRHQRLLEVIEAIDDSLSAARAE